MTNAINCDFCPVCSVIYSSVCLLTSKTFFFRLFILFQRNQIYCKMHNVYVVRFIIHLLLVGYFVIYLHRSDTSQVTEISCNNHRIFMRFKSASLVKGSSILHENYWGVFSIHLNWFCNLNLINCKLINARGYLKYNNSQGFKTHTKTRPKGVWVY